MQPIRDTNAGTPPGAGDPSQGPPPGTQPSDPPPAQDPGPAVENPNPVTPPDNAGGNPQGSPADSATGGGTASDPSGGGGDLKKESPSRVGGEAAARPTSAGPPAPSGPVALTQGTTTPLSGAPGDEVWVDQWSAFARDPAAAMPQGSAKPALRLARGGSFGGGFVLFRSSKAKQLEARARQEGQTAKASPLGARGVLPGTPGPGSGLFDLFAGSSGGGAMLTIFGLLGILAVTLIRIPSRTTAFRLPVVTWRPSAYVPPIEQPG